MDPFNLERLHHSCQILITFALSILVSFIRFTIRPALQLAYAISAARDDQVTSGSTFRDIEACAIETTFNDATMTIPSIAPPTKARSIPRHHRNAHPVYEFPAPPSVHEPSVPPGLSNMESLPRTPSDITSPLPNVKHITEFNRGTRKYQLTRAPCLDLEANDWMRHLMDLLLEKRVRMYIGDWILWGGQLGLVFHDLNWADADGAVAAYALFRAERRDAAGEWQLMENEIYAGRVATEEQQQFFLLRGRSTRKKMLLFFQRWRRRVVFDPASPGLGFKTVTHSPLPGPASPPDLIVVYSRVPQTSTTLTKQPPLS